MEVTWTQIFIGCLVIFLTTITTRFQIKSNLKEDKKIFTQLSSKGWILLITPDEQISLRQIEILGVLRNIVPMFDFLKDREKIGALGARHLTQTPAWYNIRTGKHKYGVKSLEKIKRLMT